MLNLKLQKICLINFTFYLIRTIIIHRRSITSLRTKNSFTKTIFQGKFDVIFPITNQFIINVNTVINTKNNC